MFHGPDINADDAARLGTQQDRIAVLMRDGKWRSPPEVAAAIGSSLSGGTTARIRSLRQEPWKSAYGVTDVPKRRRSGGLWEYQVQYLTTQHLDAARQFVRGEGGRPICRSVAASQMEALSQATSWPDGTAETWEAAIGQLVKQGVLSCEGDRVAYIIQDGLKSASDPQGLLF